MTSVDGDEFYARTAAIGFDYGESFQSVRCVTAGEDWASAEIEIPDRVAAELDGFIFHPAIIDGAFQTLFGAPFLGQKDNEEPYLPTRIRRCKLYGAPERLSLIHI